MVTIEDDDTFVYLIAKLASFDSAENYSYFNLNKYSGMVYVMGMDGKTQVMQTYKKGEMIGNVLDIDEVSIKNLPVSARDCMQRGTAYARTHSCNDALACAYQVGGMSEGQCGSGGGVTGGYVSVTTEYWTDYYLDRGSYMEYSGNSVYNGSSTEYVWVEYPNYSNYYQYSYSGLGNYGNEGGLIPFNVNLTPTTPKPSEIVRMILDSTTKYNNLCLYYIIEELRKKDNHHSVAPDIFNNTGTSHLSQIILDLFNTKSNYYLRWKVGEAGANTNANTKAVRNYPSNGSITFEITIDEEYLQNGSRLALARTAIHESIHAYLGYVSQSYPTDSFTQLLNNYRINHNNNNNPDLGEHLFMVQFVEAMGMSLAAFDNHRLSKDYYEALAWSGDMLLSPSFAYLSQSKRDFILAAHRAEGDANSSATSNSKSSKCN